MCFVGAALAGLSCVPEGANTDARVEGPRVLAVRIDPPETTPGGPPQRFTALVASPRGTVSVAPVQWSFCALPRTLTDPTTVPARCLDDGPWQTPFATNGTSVMASVPSDACRTAGPELPPQAGGAPRRPPDPDRTGGYYLPARFSLDLEGAYEVGFARVRLRCGRADLPSDVVRALNEGSRPNEHPALAGVWLREGDRESPLALETSTEPGPAVPPGAAVTLRIAARDGSAEEYLRPTLDGMDVERGAEVLDVSWYAAGATPQRERTRLLGGSATNVLVVDRDRTEPVWLWVVLRDDRGGVDTQALRLSLAR